MFRESCLNLFEALAAVQKAFEFEGLSTDCKLACCLSRQGWACNAMTRLVMMMLAIASGRRNFQPKLMSWS
jgi:hypothetical protein